MIFSGTEVAGSTGLKPIYGVEFRWYKNSRPVGGVNFCLLAQFLLINQRFVPHKQGECPLKIANESNHFTLTTHLCFLGRSYDLRL
jgi:hypothetical protein